MSITQKTYGWIGQGIPTQSGGANSGVFSIQEVNDLKKQQK